MTPVETLTAKVVSYNEAGRFVVLNFPLAQMPGVERRLFIYRQGAKVGEVKITGPQRDNITVADLISGEAQPGDEVKDN